MYSETERGKDVDCSDACILLQAHLHPFIETLPFWFISFLHLSFLLRISDNFLTSELIFAKIAQDFVEERTAKAKRIALLLLSVMHGSKEVAVLIVSSSWNKRPPR